MKKIELKHNKYYVNVISVLLAYATLLALTFNMDLVGDDIVRSITTSHSNIIRTLVKLEYSLNGYKIIWIIIFPVIIKYYKKVFFLSEKNRGICVPAALFSFFMIFGKSFELTGSWDLVFADYAQLIKSFIGGVGYYALFYFVIHSVFEFMENKNNSTDYKNCRGIEFFNKRPFFASFIIILIVWLLYFIAHLPGMFMYDTGMQILQSYNIEDSTAKYLNLISENVKLNDHHPIVHTLILGGFVKLGHLLFRSENIGYFFYTLLQMLISAATIAYSISYMTKKQAPLWFRMGVLIYYSIVPAFVNWAILGTKDTLFSCMMLLYIIILLEMLENESVFHNYKRMILLFFILLACSLLRNNGIHIILLSFPLLTLIQKKYLKHIILVVTGVYIIYFGFHHVLLPSLQITEGSIREAFSIPFQQTARYVRDYGNEVTEEERNAIDAIFEYDKLADKYDPDLSDPVKKLYDENSDREDLSNYFRIWFRMFFKHPDVYVQATMNNVYGYFYYSKVATPIYTYTWAQQRMDAVNETAGFNFGFIDSLAPMRKFYFEYSEAFKKLPGFSLFHSCAIYSWILIMGIAFAIRKSDKKYLAAYAPLLAMLLFCVLSPSNGNRYFRYSYPIAYCLPVVIGIQLSRLKKMGEQ